MVTPSKVIEALGRRGGIVAVLLAASAGPAPAQTYEFKTIAGHPSYGYDPEGYGAPHGSADGRGDAARFYVPSGVTADMRLVIRAVGPSLDPFGIGGLLADPRIELFDGASRRMAANDHWSEAGGLAAAELNAAFAQVGAFALTSSASKDAALLVTLAPGNYTVQVKGANSTTGVVLVEVYEVP